MITVSNEAGGPSHIATSILRKDCLAPDTGTSLKLVE